MARKQYATIQVSPETKERFLQLGSLGDSQDTVLSKLIDSWEARQKHKNVSGYRAVSRETFNTTGDAGALIINHADPVYFEVVEVRE